MGFVHASAKTATPDRFHTCLHRVLHPKVLKIPAEQHEISVNPSESSTCIEVYARVLLVSFTIVASANCHQPKVTHYTSIYQTIPYKMVAQMSAPNGENAGQKSGWNIEVTPAVVSLIQMLLNVSTLPESLLSFCAFSTHPRTRFAPL